MPMALRLDGWRQGGLRYALFRLENRRQAGKTDSRVGH